MKEQNKFNLEKITNIVIILAIIVVIGIIVKKYLFDSNEPIQKIEIGQSISIPDINWSQNGKTVILAVTKDCSHCIASVPFFSQLVDEAKKVSVKVEVVSSDSKQDGKSYLDETGIPIENIHQMSLKKNGFVSTPTLLFVNQEGIVKDMWVGRINAQNLINVLNKLNSLSSLQTSENQISNNNVNSSNQIMPMALKALLENGRNVFLVDVDTREEFRNLHIISAKNFPSDEIQIRASREIPKDKQIVSVDPNCENLLYF